MRAIKLIVFCFALTSIFAQREVTWDKFSILNNNINEIKIINSQYSFDDQYILDSCFIERILIYNRQGLILKELINSKSTNKTNPQIRLKYYYDSDSIKMIVSQKLNKDHKYIADTIYYTYHDSIVLQYSYNNKHRNNFKNITALKDNDYSITLCGLFDDEIVIETNGDTVYKDSGSYECTSYISYYKFKWDTLIKTINGDSIASALDSIIALSKSLSVNHLDTYTYFYDNTHRIIYAKSNVLGANSKKYYGRVNYVYNDAGLLMRLDYYALFPEEDQIEYIRSKSLMYEYW